MPEKSGFLLYGWFLKSVGALGSTREARFLKLRLPLVLNAKPSRFSFILSDWSVAR